VIDPPAQWVGSSTHRGCSRGGALHASCTGSGYGPDYVEYIDGSQVGTLNLRNDQGLESQLGHTLEGIDVLTDEPAIRFLLESEPEVFHSFENGPLNETAAHSAGVDLEGVLSELAEKLIRPVTVPSGHRCADRRVGKKQGSNAAHDWASGGEQQVEAVVRRDKVAVEKEDVRVG